MAKKEPFKQSPAVKIEVRGIKRIDRLLVFLKKEEIKPSGGFYLFGIGRYEACFSPKDASRVTAHLRSE